MRILSHRNHPTAFLVGVALVSALAACSSEDTAVPGRRAAGDDVPSFPEARVARWSDPATWGGALPTASTDVRIEAGTAILLDVPDAAARSVDIHHGARLAVDPRTPSVRLTTERIIVHGALQVGTPEAPYDKKAVFSFVGEERGRAPRFVADDLRGQDEAEGISGTLRQRGEGNGRLVGLWPRSNVEAGDYTITFGDSSAEPQPFTVAGPAGFEKRGMVGTLFDDRVRFTASQGSVRFATGTTRTVRVKALGASNDGMARAVLVHGGQLLIHSKTPQPVRTRVDEHVLPGATTLRLAMPVDWKADEQIVVGPTDFVGTAQGRSDRVTIRSAEAERVELTSGVEGGRWGRLQYVDTSARDSSYLSLERPNAPGAPAGVSLTYDQRAIVAHLTRPVVFESVDDAAWRERGFGVHVMIEERSSEVKVDGLEIVRGGQAGAIARYPFHLHALSWNMPNGHTLPSDGKFIGDFPGYLKHATINGSAQRGVVLHGTHGFTIEDLVAYDVRGHAIFTEDAAERQNKILRPTVLHVRDPKLEDMLQAHEVRNQTHASGSSAIWLANPDNELVDAWVGDTTNIGVWNAFGSPGCTGLHRDVPLSPKRIRLGVQRGTYAIANERRGMMTEHANATAYGTTFGASAYGPTKDDSEGGDNTEFSIRDFTLTKNGGAAGGGGYQNRVLFPHYENAIVGDNVGSDFAGQTSAPIPGHEAFIQRVLAIDTSLNRANTPESIGRAAGRHFAKTYHETWFISHAIAIGYDGILPDPATRYLGRGLFDLSDLYVQGVFRFEQFVDILRPGRPTTGWFKSPNIDGQPLELNGVRRHWSTAGAIADPNGLFVTPGRTWVADHPFLSYGIANRVPVAPAGNGFETTSSFYGLAVHYTSFDTNFYTWDEPITYTRYDPVSGARIAEFAIADGATSSFFGNMRSASVMKGGRYEVRFPGRTALDFVQGSIIDAYRPDDIVMLGVQFDEPAAHVYVGVLDERGKAPSAYRIEQGYSRALDRVGSLAEVVADTTGTKFFDDRGSRTVWFKLKGGLDILAPTQLNAFYRSMSWVVLDR